MSVWQELEQLYAKVKDRKITDLFAEDPTRFSCFSARFDDLVLDYSKTNIDAQTRDSLIALAQACRVAQSRDAMFAGAKINETEGRAVLHSSLRNLSGRPVLVDGKDVMPGVLETLERMKGFSADIRSGKITASDGQAFTDVVNIGIGGSDLGPAMAVRALAPYHNGPNVHFVSNIDPADITDTLQKLNPARTLVIIASKTFTTIETMTNAATAQAWLTADLGKAAADSHLVALSSATEKTRAFGVNPSRVFGFEDWVGGRYSLWGPIGLSLMLAIGPKNFTEFLVGAQEMDQHFETATPAQNFPILLALTGIWHNNICGYETRAILPYDQRLSRLAAYFQQLDMESNGKSVAMDGSDLKRGSGPVVWGEPGTNGQHAFYQLIHQGTRVVPCEFMLARHSHEAELNHQHQLLQANCLAQSEALMCGRSLEQARAIMQAKGLQGDELERQARHRVFSGNRPSVTLIYDQLTPRNLGRILALYEHRVFVEGVIWGLNSFDQWGVELGKELAVQILPLIADDVSAAGKDGSTQGLLSEIKQG